MRLEAGAHDGGLGRMVEKPRGSRFVGLVVSAVLLAAALLGWGRGASADVEAVKGSDYGFFGNVSLFQGHGVTDGATTTTPAPATTSEPTTTVPAPEPVLCDGLEPTIVGTGPQAGSQALDNKGKAGQKVPEHIRARRAGDDTINGTPGDDVIMGLGGNDTIDGLGGNDVICGGSGSDTLAGGDGDDRILGGAGDDRIDGGAGDYDYLDGGDGNDTIEGGIGFDEIYGGSGDNTLSGGPDDDFIGIFTIDIGDNLVLGGTGNDFLYVESPEAFGDGDRYEGGDGNDVLSGVQAGGVYVGGLGDDNVNLMSAGTFYGGPGNDSVSRMLAPGGTFYGGDGADEIPGGQTGGTFYGEAGNDYGGVLLGNAVFLGGEGNEIVSGAQEQSLYCGGVGDDSAAMLSVFQDPPGTPHPLAGGTFYGEEGIDQVGLFLPGGTFFQDGACPVAYVPPPAAP